MYSSVVVVLLGIAGDIFAVVLGTVGVVRSLGTGVVGACSLGHLAYHHVGLYVGLLEVPDTFVHCVAFMVPALGFAA